MTLWVVVEAKKWCCGSCRWNFGDGAGLCTYNVEGPARVVVKHGDEIYHIF